MPQQRSAIRSTNSTAPSPVACLLHWFAYSMILIWRTMPCMRHHPWVRQAPVSRKDLRVRQHLWTVTRYVHLNPVRAGMVEHPAAWAWSSYPGYARRARRLEWLAYDDLLASWTRAFGGPQP